MSLRRSLAVSSLALVSACTAAGEQGAEPIAETSSPIVGGVPDTFRTYVVGVGDKNGVFCTGTLISRRTVLTAGHCYTPSKAKGGITKIYFGQFVNLQHDPPPTVVDTAQVVRHPGYDDATLSNDLTLVQLAADAPSQPVPLLRETMTNTPDFVGPSFTFSGYGNDGSFNYDVRRVAVFPIQRVGPASDVGQDTSSGPIDATQFYYRVANKNTCDGDSGGPAFAVRAGVERLAGATSYGDQACKIDGVDARTDQPAIDAFIQPTIDMFEGTDPCRADGVCDESCNVNDTLVDPDCAPNHCGADGMCVLSCVDPPDPDCTGTDHCGADGVCDPTCATADPDCAQPGAGGAGGAGTTTASSSSGSAGGSGGAGGEATGSGGSMIKSMDAGADAGDEAESTGGCSFAVPGGTGDARLTLALAAVGAVVVRRRKRG